MVNLTTIRPGISVATQHAPRFKGLLDDLDAAGYGIDQKQSGGYNYRNIDGTNKLSNHAYGTAVDVNWNANARGTHGNIPPDLARSLAAKHGLTWGGDWKNPDPMHFEVASAGPVPIGRRGLTTYAGLGKPSSATQQPGTSPMPAPMALGMTQPPSQDQVNLFAKRGMSMMPDWNRPIGHWTQALGNMAQQISGSMWLDKAEKGMAEQQAYVGDAMRRYNTPGMTAPPTASGAASAAASGFGPQGMTTPPINNPALAPQKPKVAPDAAPAVQLQATSQQAAPSQQQTATTQPPPATSAPAAPALSSQRPGFATTPDVLDTERERQQETVLAEMMASGVPSAVEFAKAQLANINQKRLQYGLQNQQMQNQRQLAMTEAAYKSLQTIDEQEAMGIISADQARMRRQSLAQYNPEIGRIVAQLPSMAASVAPHPPAPTSAPSAPPSLGSGASVINSGNPTPAATQGAQPVMGAPDNRVPYGAQSSTIMPNDSGLEMRMPELSPRALQLQRTIDYYASKGDGRSAGVYENQLKQEPSYIARQKAAEKVGATNEAAEKSRKAGARALDVFDRMKANAEAWFEHAPKAAMGAIGPVQGTDEYQKWVNGLPLIGNAGAQNFHTRLMHDVDAIAVQLRAITGAGGQSNEFMDRTFKDAIGKAIASNDKESFFAILDSARNVILQASQLPPGYKPPTFNGQLTPEEVAAVNKFADPGKQIQTSAPVRVSGPEEAARLPSGTRFVTPDGREMVKH